MARSLWNLTAMLWWLKLPILWLRDFTRSYYIIRCFITSIFGNGYQYSDITLASWLLSWYLLIWTSHCNSLDDRVPVDGIIKWWRHQMEKQFRVTGPSWEESTRSFDVFFTCAWTDGWANNWDAGALKTPSCSFWRHCNSVSALHTNTMVNVQ